MPGPLDSYLSGGQQKQLGPFAKPFGQDVDNTNYTGMGGGITKQGPTNQAYAAANKEKAQQMVNRSIGFSADRGQYGEGESRSDARIIAGAQAQGQPVYFSQLAKEDTSGLETQARNQVNQVSQQAMSPANTFQKIWAQTHPGETINNALSDDAKLKDLQDRLGVAARFNAYADLHNERSSGFEKALGDQNVGGLQAYLQGAYGNDKTQQDAAQAQVDAATKQAQDAFSGKVNDMISQRAAQAQSVLDNNLRLQQEGRTASEQAQIALQTNFDTGLNAANAMTPKGAADLQAIGKQMVSGGMPPSVVKQQMKQQILQGVHVADPSSPNYAKDKYKMFDNLGLSSSGMYVIGNDKLKQLNASLGLGLPNGRLISVDKVASAIRAAFDRLQKQIDSWDLGKGPQLTKMEDYLRANPVE